jgi:hypothetical protein
VAVSAIIVNYNAGPLLVDSVRAVLEHNGDAEAVVVDNGSVDDSLEQLRLTFGRHPRLTVIENRANLGFARATNIGLVHARGEFLLLLNPDCLVQPGTIPTMVETLRADPEVGMAGCLIRNPDGSEQPGCRRAVPTPWRTFVRVLHLNKLFPHHPRFRTFVLSHEPLPAQPMPIEAISGAFMLVRREALEQIGPLDEDYFMHCEDLDWCMRFHNSGWRILFVPGAEAVHYKGTCSRNNRIVVLYHMHRGMMRFYRKFFWRQYPAGLMALVGAAVWARFAILAGREMVGRVSRRARDDRARLPARRIPGQAGLVVRKITRSAPPATSSLSVVAQETDVVPGFDPVAHRRAASRGVGGKWGVGSRSK